MSAWQQFAPCASADPDAWFPEDGKVPNQARHVCSSCPYRQPCLAGAVERGEEYGVWGGMTASQIRRLRRELGLNQPRPQGSDLVCPAGHERDGNTYVKPSGKRVCRPCNGAQVRRYRESKRVAA